MTASGTCRLVIASATILLSVVGTNFAGHDFPHLQLPLSQLYRSPSDIMATITLEKDVILRAELKSRSGKRLGRFDAPEQQDRSHPEADNSHWGQVALLTYWWAKNGKRDNDVAAAARRGLQFGLIHRNATDDPDDTRFLRKTNLRYDYARYDLDNRRPGGNYPSTAWTLLAKALILQHGSDLYSTTELASLARQAKSHWHWLTRASQYSPQRSANQTMGAILGGYLLARATDDLQLVDEVLAYYHAGLPDTNLPPARGGYRDVARIQQHGYAIFAEQGGFDTHYGLVQLTFHAALIPLLEQGNESLIYTDAMEQARYLNARLSAGGTMIGGTRNNEIGGSSSSVAIALGANYFGKELDVDLGRTRIKKGDLTHLTSAHALNLGHRAFGIILFHDHFRQWSQRRLACNNRVALRHDSVSVQFTESGRPKRFP